MQQNISLCAVLCLPHWLRQGGQKCKQLTANLPAACCCWNCCAEFMRLVTKALMAGFM
jgi:hypothetical protein